MNTEQLNNLRDKFEAWIVGRPFYKKARMFMTQNADGSYRCFGVNDRWNAWYAAAMAVRADVVAELDALPRIDVYAHVPACNCCSPEIREDPCAYGNYVDHENIDNLKERFK